MGREQVQYKIPLLGLEYVVVSPTAASQSVSSISHSPLSLLLLQLARLVRFPSALSLFLPLVPHGLLPFSCAHFRRMAVATAGRGKATAIHKNAL